MLNIVSSWLDCLWVYSGKQSKGTQGRSTHLCWPELVLRYAVRSWRAKYWPKPLNKSQIHVENFQGCHFLRKKSPCGMLHNESKSFYNLFRSPQYAGLLHIPFNLNKYAVRSQNPNNKHIPFDCVSEYSRMCKTTYENILPLGIGLHAEKDMELGFWSLRFPRWRALNRKLTPASNERP